MSNIIYLTTFQLIFTVDYIFLVKFITSSFLSDLIFIHVDLITVRVIKFAQS